MQELLSWAWLAGLNGFLLKLKVFGRNERDQGSWLAWRILQAWLLGLDGLPLEIRHFKGNAGSTHYNRFDENPDSRGCWPRTTYTILPTCISMRIIWNVMGTLYLCCCVVKLFDRSHIVKAIGSEASTTNTAPSFPEGTYTTRGWLEPEKGTLKPQQ